MAALAGRAVTRNAALRNQRQGLAMTATFLQVAPNPAVTLARRDFGVHPLDLLSIRLIESGDFLRQSL
jgi:hypothetical protein